MKRWKTYTITISIISLNLKKHQRNKGERIDYRKLPVNEVIFENRVSGKNQSNRQLQCHNKKYHSGHNIRRYYRHVLKPHKRPRNKCKRAQYERIPDFVEDPR